ncbi:MAG: hypothetical protein LBQ88_11710 [Treponema sp.]|jgi:hypothetical protein|nr:hypothetical protein [Treponema sp.]
MKCEDCDYCYCSQVGDDDNDFDDACERYGKWISEVEDCPVWHEKEETP